MPQEPGDRNDDRTRNWVAFALLAIVFLSALVRLYPALLHFVWGSDSGEYYFITKHIVDKGGPPTDYDGWGFAYPYFTGMELLAAALHQTTGLPVSFCLFVVVPMTASLLVLPIFLITQEIGRDPRISLIAAGVMAVTAANVFPSSHPMPGALGDLLQLFATFTFIKIFRHYRPEIGGEKKGGTGKRSRGEGKNGEEEIDEGEKAKGNKGLPGISELFSPSLVRKRYIILFLFFCGSLALTHHLSLYFVFLTVFFVMLFDALTVFHRARFLLQCSLVLFLTVVPTLYWALAYPDFRANIMDVTLLVGGTPVSFFLLFPVGVLVLLVFFTLLYLNKMQFADPGTMGTFKSILFGLLGWIFLLSSLLTYIGVFGVPGTDLDVPDHIAIYFGTFVITVSLAPVGRQLLRSTERGFLIYAWFIGCISSFIVNSALSSTVLLGYRHVQYFIEPLAIMAAFGLIFLYDYFVVKFAPVADARETKDGTLEFFMDRAALREKARVEKATIVLVTLLVTLSVFSAYPPPAIMGGFEEGTSYREFQAVLWIRANLGDDTKLVTDHRMSSLSFGLGDHLASWDSYKEIYVSENYDEIQELMQKENLTFVLLTDTIQEGVALLQWENAEPMTQESIQKFETSPFITLFDNGECQIYMRVD